MSVFFPRFRASIEKHLSNALRFVGALVGGEEGGQGVAHGGDERHVGIGYAQVAHRVLGHTLNQFTVHDRGPFGSSAQWVTSGIGSESKSGYVYGTHHPSPS